MKNRLTLTSMVVLIAGLTVASPGAAAGKRNAEGRLENPADLAMGEAGFLVEVDGEGLSGRAQLAGGGTEGVTGLERMAALHAVSAVAATSDMDAELAAEGFARDFALVLFGDFRLLQVLGTTVRARLRKGRFVFFVTVCGRLAVGVAAVGVARFAARRFGVRLGRAFGEGGRLPLPSPPGFFDEVLELADAHRKGLDFGLKPAAVGALGAGGHALGIVVWPNRFF